MCEIFFIFSCMCLKSFVSRKWQLISILLMDLKLFKSIDLCNESVLSFDTRFPLKVMKKITKILFYRYKKTLKLTVIMEYLNRCIFWYIYLLLTQGMKLSYSCDSYNNYDIISFFTKTVPKLYKKYFCRTFWCLETSFCSMYLPVWYVSGRKEYKVDSVSKISRLLKRLLR